MNRNTKSKFIYFVLGVAATTALSVAAGQTDPYEGLIKLLAKEIDESNSKSQKSFEKLLDDRDRKQDEDLAKIPDRIDCKSLGWMRNCQEINKQAKLNPSSSMRVINKDGVEIVFEPTTPAVMVNHMLVGTPESAKAVYNYMAAQWKIADTSARSYEDVLFKNGGQLPGTQSIEESSSIDRKASPEVDVNKTRITLIGASNCNFCLRQLSILRDLKKTYPKLNVVVYEWDNNPQFLKEEIIGSGFTGRILSPQDQNDLIQRGVTSYPTLWIDNPDNKRRQVLKHIQNYESLERSLRVMTKIEPLASK